MFGHVEMDDTSASVCQHNKHKQNPQLNCGNGEEVDGDYLANVIGEKGLPSLGWTFSALWHQARDRALGDVETEFQKFPMTRGAPQSEFAAAIFRINVRISTDTRGRPDPFL